MKRIRAVAILIRGDEVLLMHRKNEHQEFHCFPGGGVEEGEKVEEAVVRELLEETTIDIKINKLLYHHIHDNDTEQFFYLCDYIKGEPKLAEDSEEKAEMINGKEFFNPYWEKIENIKDMLLYPLEIRDLLLEDYKNNFTEPTKEFVIKISDLRQSL